MTEWTVKVDKITDNQTRLLVDLIILGDNVEYKRETVNLEGDNIDLTVLKTKILKVVKRLDGVVNNANPILNMENKEFVADAQFSDLTLKQ